MLKKLTIYLAIFSLSGTLANAQDEAEFQQYLQQNQAEFDDFAQQREKEFELFVKRWKKAESAYRKEIAKHWDKAEITDKKRWIQYSDDKRHRTIVNYEENTITVEMLGNPNDSSVLNTAERAIEKLNETSVEEAIHSDPVFINAGVDTKTNNRTQKGDKAPVLGQKFNKHSLKPEQAKVQRTKKKVSVTVKMPDSVVSDRVKKVLPAAESYARQWGLSTALVLAVIHTESSFNPLARSHVPAFGLMQIVPTSAGKDVTEFLHGEQRLLSPEYLFDPELNIQAGSVYLHLLINRYFKNVGNTKSQFYLAVAAYNTGPGNVAKAMSNSTSLTAATRSANALSPNQVYQRLMRYLPASETKNYLNKVTEREALYQQTLGL